jgi:two-component system response regulator FixJ
MLPPLATGPSPTPTVFVIDDDESFLASVARLFRASGFRVKAFASATEFLDQRPPEVPGCVVADLRMPEMDGLKLQALLAGSENPLPVVFLTAQGDIPTSVEAMRHGAEDFLSKMAPKEDLLAAVKRALERDASDRQEREQQRQRRAGFDRLTAREREVLVHVLRGQLNKQIAADLGIDERSVKRHRTNLMRKLNVESVAGLVQLAVAAGFKE